MNDTTPVRASGPSEPLRLSAGRSHPKVLELARLLARQAAKEAVASAGNVDTTATYKVMEI